MSGNPWDCLTVLASGDAKILKARALALLLWAELRTNQRANSPSDLRTAGAAYCKAYGGTSSGNRKLRHSGHPAQRVGAAKLLISREHQSRFNDATRPVRGMDQA